MRDINILKTNGIDVDSAIDILGDIDMYNETLQDYLDENKERLPKLEKYYKNKDMDNYAIIVHAIKSDSKYLGFTVLADMALNHQLKSQDNDYDYVSSHYDDLMDEISRVNDLVEKYIIL